jgi:hypothetical protein
MKNTIARVLPPLGLAVALSLSMIGPASATTVLGTLTFNGGTINYYLPGNGYVPAGYGNSSGQPVTIGAGIEFGFMDGANTDTADFTLTSLTLRDISPSVGSASWQQTFTASDVGFFSGWTMLSETFAGAVTYSIVADTLTISWNGTPGSFDANAVFVLGHSNAPGVVPVPAALPLFMTGLGVLGLAGYRRKHKATA